MEMIDARGMACPRPVVMTKEAVDRHEAEIEVLVDNPVAASNVLRFLRKSGFEATSEEDAGNITVRGLREKSGTGSTPEKNGDIRESGDVAVLVCQEVLGGADRELGEVLMKGFMSTLADREIPPRVVALMNEGVRLALPDHSASDSLRKMESRGVSVLVCGTCTDHFGITGQVQAGTISNMFEITEALMDAGHTITLG